MSTATKDVSTNKDSLASRKGEPKRKVLLYMPESYDDALDYASFVLGKPKSEVFRLALAAFFERFDESKIEEFDKKRSAMASFKGKSK
jgi:hypothetical protein